MRKIKAQCESCGGTGVYSGFCEAKGTAVVCLTCDGTGCHEIRYVPFTKRKNRKGIHTVSLSRGGFLATDVGEIEGTSMTYKEFTEK